MVEKMINATGAFRTIKKLNSKKIIVEIGESVIYVNQTNEKLNRCGDKMSSETHYYFTSDYTLLYKKYQNADYDDFCGDRPGHDRPHHDIPTDQDPPTIDHIPKELPRKRVLIRESN